MALAVVLDQLADGLPAVKAVLALVFPLILFIMLRHSRDATRSNSIREHKRMPPSPPAMPLIGHLHHIAGRLPHVSLRDLAARQQGDGGLMLLHLGTVPTLVVSSPHAAQQVLCTHDASFASRPGSVVGDILSYRPSDVGFAPYGEWWWQAKKLVIMHLLALKKVQSYRPAREEVGAVIARIRGAAVAAHGPVDMSELLSSFTNDILCCAVAGRSFRVEGRNKVFRELIDAGMVIVGEFNLENFYPRLAKVAGGMLTWPARRRAEKLRGRWDNIFDTLIDEHAREMAGADGGADLQESDFIVHTCALVRTRRVWTHQKQHQGYSSISWRAEFPPQFLGEFTKCIPFPPQFLGEQNLQSETSPHD